MPSTDAYEIDDLIPVVSRMVIEINSAIRSGQERLLVVSPPATGKTTAATRVAFAHFFTKDSEKQKKILYIGSNRETVQRQCERLASFAPNGLNDWDLAKDSTATSIVGVTWRQLVHLDLSQDEFTLIIADDAHHGVSTRPSHFLASAKCPVIGFTNSKRHTLDTLTQNRKDTDLVIKEGENQITEFFGDPIVDVQYRDLEELEISRSFPIRTVAGPGYITSHLDTRIAAIVSAYANIVQQNGKCKTLIRTDSIEQAEALKVMLRKAFIVYRPALDSTFPLIETFHSDLTPQEKDRTIDTFYSGKTPILIHCSTFDEGHVINDLGLIVIASRIRTPHVYDRICGRLHHSKAEGKLVLDLMANPANFYNRSGHPGTGQYELKVPFEDIDTDTKCTETTLTFGTSDIDPEAINSDSLRISPLWTRESAALAVADLHKHGIGTQETIPTRAQIEEGAQRGLCPPPWILFSDHGREGFFSDGEDLAKEIGRYANQYSRSKLTKPQVLDAIRQEWEKDPAQDGLFTKKWLQAKCNGQTLPFRLRTIVGNDTMFSNFTQLSKALKLKSVYFRGLSQDEALKQLKNLFKKQNGKPAIAKKGKPITHEMIREGSKQRICPSQFNLFQHGHGNNPIFPGGLNEVNRLLGFTIFADMSKEDVLAAVRGLSDDNWKDRRFSASQKEINTAHQKGKLPFSTRDIIGIDKMWETKDSFDSDLGYRETPFFYRSLRQQIRFGKI